MNLRENLSFGFEATFTIPNWWQEPGFSSTWETPEKLARMKALAEGLATRLRQRVVSVKDSYGAEAFELLDDQDRVGFRVTPEPGSIEVNTPPALLADVHAMMSPLYEAAEEAGLVPYRSWWYGVRGGTSGGCHVNMAGLEEATNPWKNDPALVLKYFAHFHNRPFLHYPFMGPDVGRGGNCMRMDEHGEAGVPSSLARFEAAREKISRGWTPSADEIFEFFEGAPLREIKHCAPTLRKMKAPWYLVEDRAMEMLFSAEDCVSVCELRIRALEKLQQDRGIEALRHFGPELHEEELSHDHLWRQFSAYARELGMDPSRFTVFFERQFPKLLLGEDIAKRVLIREGRRERKVLGVSEAHGTLVLSKKVDTRYKRLEFHLLNPGGHAGLPAVALRVNGVKFKSGPNGVLLDLYVPFGNERANPVLLDIEVLCEEGRTVERTTFDPNAMMYVARRERPFQDRNPPVERGTGFYSMENETEFAVF